MKRQRLSLVLNVFLWASFLLLLTCGKQSYATTDAQQSLSKLTEKAERGDVNAQEMLGIHYWNSKTPGDMPKAIKWLTKAAEQDDEMAQSILANIYARGEGTEQDYKTAIMWYRKAANNGSDRDMLILANLYEKGIGVPQDYREAYYWLSLAALHPRNNSKTRLSELSVHLSPAQISAIQQRADKWRPNPSSKINSLFRTVCDSYYADVEAIYWHIKYPPPASPVPAPSLSELESVTEQALKTVLTANSATDGKDGILAIKTDKSAEEVLRQHPRALYAGIRARFEVAASYEGLTIKQLTTYVETQRSDAFSEHSRMFAGPSFIETIQNPEIKTSVPYIDTLKHALHSLSCTILANSANKLCQTTGESTTTVAMPRSCP